MSCIQNLKLILTDRFCELLMEYGACEDNSDLVLESLEPLMQQPTFSPQAFTQYPGGKAAAQLASWVQGVHSLHSTLQTKIRPLQAKISTMQASLSEYTDRLKGQENKIRVLDERLSGLSVALETASVDKSRQADLVRAMHREWGHTKEFIQVSYYVHESVCMYWNYILILLLLFLSHKPLSKPL